MQLQDWTDSATYRRLLQFIADLSANALTNQPCQCTLVIELAAIELLLDTQFKTPHFSGSRFGSSDFRTFIREVARDHPHLSACFGSPERLDYGTGHELGFIMLCMRANLQSQDFYSAYPQYYHTARAVIRRFRLEPAGSRGIWGLDDYFYGPFLFGAAQLTKSPVLTPEEAVSYQQAQQYRSSHLYLEAICDNYESKGSNFHEHSSTLWGISSIPTWRKIHEGLVKMYTKEVLQSPTLVQHLSLNEELMGEVYK